MKSKNMLATNPVHEKRQNEDFYATDPKALEVFIEALERDGISLCKDIWECAVGAGHLSGLLENKEYNVKKSDIVDRGCNAEIRDFLTTDEKFDGDILTNPPFVLAEKFVEKAIEILENGKRLYLFLKIQFLEGQSRAKLFQKYKPKYVYVNSKRQHTAMNGEFDKYGMSIGTLCYCWFVWEKGWNGETVIRWI